MTYELLIGQRTHSSWSLRGWLPFAMWDIPVRISTAELYGESFAATVTAFGGARTVPALRTPRGGMLTDSLAIAWHLAEAFPDRGLLPADPVVRAEAQSQIAEMHSGFAALRDACPMNLGTAWDTFEPSAPVLSDLERVETLWGQALERSGGPWLHGAYSLADVFYAPVATRIATYRLPVGETARTYVATTLALPQMRRWRAMGAAEGPELPQYRMDLPRLPYPAPPVLPARAVASGPSENATCPYSGKPVTHFAEIEGRIFGFCNAFCRDKTVADAEAWPAFMKIFDLR